jgi:hypothetical protein
VRAIAEWAGTTTLHRRAGKPYFSILLCTCQKRRVRWAVSSDNLP